MIAELPFNAGWFLGRAVGLPVLLLGFLVYAATAFSRKLTKQVKSVLRFVLSLILSISAFIFSLAVLEAAKEVEYDLRELIPAQLRIATMELFAHLSNLLASKWAVTAVEYVLDNSPLISQAMVAALLVPLFTYGISAFLTAVRWFICLIPNILLGFFRGFWVSFEYIRCATSLTNHHNHPNCLETPFQRLIQSRAHYSSTLRLASPKPENEDGVKTIILARPREMLTQPAWPLRQYLVAVTRKEQAAATCSDGGRWTC